MAMSLSLKTKSQKKDILPTRPLDTLEPPHWETFFSSRGAAPRLVVVDKRTQRRHALHRGHSSRQSLCNIMLTRRHADTHARGNTIQTSYACHCREYTPAGPPPRWTTLTSRLFPPMRSRCSRRTRRESKTGICGY